MSFLYLNPQFVIPVKIVACRLKVRTSPGTSHCQPTGFQFTPKQILNEAADIVVLLNSLATVSLLFDCLQYLGMMTNLGNEFVNPVNVTFRRLRKFLHRMD